LGTLQNTVRVGLDDGTTFINSGISLDGKYHNHNNHLYSLLPKTKPYDLALRCDTDGNVPQIQFKQDGVWHDFAPSGRTGQKAGPWFPYLYLGNYARLSDHRVQPSQPAPAPAPPQQDEEEKEEKEEEVAEHAALAAAAAAAERVALENVFVALTIEQEEEVNEADRLVQRKVDAAQEALRREREDFDTALRTHAQHETAERHRQEQEVEEEKQRLQRLLRATEESSALDSSGKAPVPAVGPLSGSTDDCIRVSFGPAPGFAWPEEKRAALSAALQEEEFFTAASVAKMSDEDAAEIITAAGLKKGSAREFKEALAALRSGSSAPPALATAPLQLDAFPFDLDRSKCIPFPSPGPDSALTPPLDLGLSVW
jgi:hypothetical protein